MCPTQYVTQISKIPLLQNCFPKTHSIQAIVREERRRVWLHTGHLLVAKGRGFGSPDSSEQNRTTLVYLNIFIQQYPVAVIS